MTINLNSFKQFKQNFFKILFITLIVAEVIKLNLFLVILVIFLRNNHPLEQNYANYLELLRLK